MHSSLHNILANESARERVAEGRKARTRRTRSLRRSLSDLASKVARVHGIPPRAHPEAAASLRGR
jgi:hypothetical protein